MIEREVKLRFDSPEEARAAILAAGATPLRCRRMQEDALLDADDESLRRPAVCPQGSAPKPAGVC